MYMKVFVDTDDDLRLARRCLKTPYRCILQCDTPCKTPYWYSVKTPCKKASGCSLYHGGLVQTVVSAHQ